MDVSAKAGNNKFPTNDSTDVWSQRDGNFRDTGNVLEVRVKGKSEPVRIFALLGEEDLASSAAFQALVEDHAVLLTAYRVQNWQIARAQLAQCRAKAAELGLGLEAFYDLYGERIGAFEAAPPPPEWDGVFVALMK